MESLAPKVLGSVTAMGYYYCNCAPHTIWWSQTISFAYWHTARHHGCIWCLNTGIWLTTSSPGKKMQRESELQRPCAEQTVGQTTGWFCQKVTWRWLLRDIHRARKCSKSLICPDWSTTQLLRSSSDLDKKLENLTWEMLLCKTIGQLLRT